MLGDEGTGLVHMAPDHGEDDFELCKANGIDPVFAVEGDGVWEMAGDVHVDEVERSLGVDLPRGHYETIAGLVIAAAGTLPEPDTRLTIELPPDPGDLVHADDPAPRHLQVQVLAVDRHVPSRVRLELPDRADTAAGAARAAAAAGKTSR